MKRIIQTLILLAAFTGILFSQTSSFKGRIIDNYTGKGIYNANLKMNSAGTSADEDGNFSIDNLKPGDYNIIVSHIGYVSVSFNIKLPADTTFKRVIRLTPAPVRLGDITVVSTRYIQSVKDAAMPMEVVEKKEISRLPAVTPADILNGEPGISIVRDGIWATDVSIRGLSRSNIVLLVDGNRIETASDLAAGLSMISLPDIKRIEVIKGAASSLYGTGALGGIVNLITDDGSYSNKFKVGGSLLSGYNSVNNGTTNWIELNAGSDIWHAHISGTYGKADNTQTPRGVLTNSQYSYNNLSASFAIKPMVKNELKLVYQRYYAKDVGIPGGYPLFPSQAVVSYPWEKRDMFSAEYSVKNISKKFTGLSFKYFNQNIYRDVENIPYITQTVYGSNGVPVKKIDVQKINPNARHYTNGLQLQTNWLFYDNNILVAGLDAWQRRLDSRRERYLLINVLDSTGDSVVKSMNETIGERPLPEALYRSYGIYFQDEYRIQPKKLSITLGGRLDRIDVSNDSVSNPVYTISNGIRNNNPAGQTLYWSDSKEHDVSWSGSLGVLYTVLPGIDLSLNLSRAFRSPSLEERFQYIDLGNLIRLGNPNLKPEKGYYFDWGLRIWKPEFSLKADVFLNSMNDLVAEVPGTYEGRAAAVKTNIGKAKLYGFDLSSEFNFYKDCVLYMNASYVRGKDTGDDTNLPMIPPLNGKVGLKIPVMNYFKVDASSVMFDSQNKISEGETGTPGYVYFNIYLESESIQFGSASLNLFAGVENLTNKAYRNHLSTNRGTIVVEPGRNFFLKIKASFN